MLSSGGHGMYTVSSQQVVLLAWMKKATHVPPEDGGRPTSCRMRVVQVCIGAKHAFSIEELVVNRDLLVFDFLNWTGHN